MRPFVLIGFRSGGLSTMASALAGRGGIHLKDMPIEDWDDLPIGDWSHERALAVLDLALTDLPPESRSVGFCLEYDEAAILTSLGVLRSFANAHEPQIVVIRCANLLRCWAAREIELRRFEQNRRFSAHISDPQVELEPFAISAQSVEVFVLRTLEQERTLHSGLLGMPVWRPIHEDFEYDLGGAVYLLFRLLGLADQLEEAGPKGHAALDPEPVISNYADLRARLGPIYPHRCW